MFPPASLYAPLITAPLEIVVVSKNAVVVSAFGAAAFELRFQVNPLLRLRLSVGVVAVVNVCEFFTSPL